VLECRAGIAQLLDLRELMLVLAEDQAGAGVLTHGMAELVIAHLTPSALVVEAQGRAAGTRPRSQHHLAQGRADLGGWQRRPCCHSLGCVRHLDSDSGVEGDSRR
jgi:hypothetical protein